MTPLSDVQINQFMSAALEEARLAQVEGEVPVGAVLVYQDQIIARAHNQREASQQAVDHAEILTIEQANTTQHNWRLADTRLFVTVEPCLMCAGAIIQARIPEVYYGVADPKFGAVESLYQALTDQRANHRVTVKGGVLAEDSAELMQSFFQNIRNKRSNNV